MTWSRWWNEFVAALDDAVGLPLLVLLLLGAATVVAVLWYWYPAWLRLPDLHPSRWRAPRWRWPRLRWPRWNWRWRRRTRKPAAEPDLAEPVDGAELPDLPAEAFASLADRLAAEGRYAEAVRERLRAIVRELVERGLIEHRPGWTVTELAAAAAAVRPGLRGPLTEAAGLFSAIWYGQRPAMAGHDARMRGLAGAVHTALANGAGRVPAGAGVGGRA